jgi:hypothetical protein
VSGKRQAEGAKQEDRKGMKTGREQKNFDGITKSTEFF